ncbi:MAG: hypothetical protein PWQ18_469 [Clostridia bacterium]|nr:hypothetical protein [Clostridia bacterium]
MAAITLVAPYPSLGELATAICQEFNWPVEVVVGRAVRGLELAREAERRGTQVIVSRGITAERIRAALELPVVEIPVTGFDMLRAYLEARQAGVPVGVADEKSIVAGFTTLGEMLGEKVLTFELQDERDLRRAVTYLKGAGARAIVGKATITRLVESHRLKGTLITSGREAVIQALEEAQRVLEVRRQEMAKLQEMKAILDFNSDAIVAVDAKGVIRAFNPAAERLLGWPRERVLGVPVAEVFPWPVLDRVWRTGRAEQGELVPAGTYQVVLNCIPILVDGQTRGLILTMQDVQQIQSLEHKIRRNLTNRGYVARYTFADIIGQGPAIREAVKQAERFSQVDSTVLICAETGCGKEMFAQAIHQASPRRGGPFVAVNCAALPENLLESELFGYVEGAFTGARKGGKAGLFELAHNGTLFLDEIGEMSEGLQARVLRVLEEGQVMRLGGDRLLPVNVRVIAATNRDLKQMVREKQFREDLYYRIHVLTLRVPPLRLRREDIPLLLQFFLREYCHKFKKDIKQTEAEAIALLQHYPWPGNVRELRNTVERLVLLADGPVVTSDLVRQLLAEDLAAADALTVGEGAGELLEKAEQEVINRVLQATGGNRTEAARRLGIGRTTLWRKLKGKEPAGVS